MFSIGNESTLLIGRGHYVTSKRTNVAFEHAEAIVDTVREPLVVLDENLKVITANKSFYKIFHVTKKDTLRRSIYALGNGQWDNPKLKHLLNDILPKKSWFQNFEIEHDFPLIGRRIVLLNARRLHQKNTNEQLILLAIEDITERRHIERQKDDFIGIASHELKTPVTSIRAYGQILQKHHLQTKDKKAAFLLSKMDKQLIRLNELVASFVNVYKLQTGKLKLRKKTFSLNELVDEVVGNFQYTLQSHSITKKDFSKTEIFADRTRISQVLINLISNAIKYSPQETNVVIQVATTKKEVTVSIEDFGMGIPKEEQLNVFERFFRAKGKREGSIPGLGLGLFISTEIVKQHKGKLWVKSTEGKGSTFYFTLPIL